MKTVFLGTPDAAVPALRALESITDISAVFTQPDRPRGRSRTPVPPPVKTAALDLGLDVFQPADSVEVSKTLATLGEVSVAVIVAYGMLIRPDALAVPRYGFVNVHFSILPRWRGAAPVQRAIEAGDNRVGVTLMQLDEGLDTGPILATRSTALAAGETSEAVLNRLAIDGARLLTEKLGSFVSGAIAPTPQQDEHATHATKVTSNDRPIEVSNGRVEIVRKVQALSPNPGATLSIDGAPHKILSAAASPESRDPARPLRFVDGRLLLTVADGVVELILIQPPGKRPMRGQDWARGRHGGLGELT